MNIEEFRKALSSDATEENAKLKDQLQKLQHDSKEAISKLKNENENLKEDCLALCNRCFALTRGSFCLFCGLNYHCPHMPGIDEQMAMINKANNLRKGIERNG